MTGNERLHFEDFVPGSGREYGSTRIEEAPMFEFAREFDPQPMHLDATSDQAKLMGGVIASGWYTAGVNMRLLTDGMLLKSAGMGSPGISKLRWLAPVRVGDTLTSRLEVLERRASTSKPDRGFVDFRFEVRNQDGVVVMEQINLIMFGRREPGAAVEAPRSSIAPPPAEAFASEANAESLGLIEEIRPGTVLRLGTYDFTPDNIIGFARRFDPQPFHLSEAGGKATHFGGLSASGWHTASAWMRTLSDFWASRAAMGIHIPKRGPGMGFDNLSWLRPVLAGDQLTYFTRVEGARRSASRPGWGVLNLRNYALNQKSVPVFAFSGASLWQARD